MKNEIKEFKFEEFTIYECSNAHSFVYADFNEEDILIKGLANYLFQEINLLNYANSITKTEFNPSKKIYKKLYNMIASFLNQELETLTFDEESEEIHDVLEEEYKFVDINGKTRIQKDKIGKIGEYMFHLILSNYFNVSCIIPKFKCTTDRNMSVFGIDALFFDKEKNTILFGESKVCKNIENAIKLVNRSLTDYEEQIAEEYRLILSNDEGIYNLSREFVDVFQQHSEICITFKEFVKQADIQRIFVPIFIAHGKSKDDDKISEYLEKMIGKIKTSSFFGIETCYIFISLPIINKDKAIDEIMIEVVKKSNEFKRRNATL